MAHSPVRSAIDVGSVIADTYTIEGLLGRGGMGAVFVASHLRLPGKRVAIKVLHPELVDDEIFARFQREAEIASRLGHPGIVSVLDFNITPDGVPYLVLELLEGHTLAERIAQGPMPMAEIIPIVRQLGSALSAAHAEGIVHRDLKPQNIFLVPTDVGGAEVDAVKILDFGISKIRGSLTVQTHESALLGTPQYMAPEQAKGAHDQVDERTDLFALGVIVYEMLCGAPAFAGTSVPEVVFKVVYEPAPPLAPRAPGTPPTVIAAVEKAMQKAIGDRFATVAEFVHALTGEALAPRARRSSIVPSRSGGGSTKPGVGSTSPRLPGAAAAGVEATAAASSQAALGIAATVGSAPGNAAVPLALEATAAVTTGGASRRAASPISLIEPMPTSAPAASAPPRSRRGLVLGLGALALVGVAIAAFALGGGRGATAPAAPAVAGLALPDARAGVSDARPAPTVDARSAAGSIDAARATPRPDARPTARPDARPRPDASPPRPDASKHEGDPPEEVGGAAAAIEAALAAGDWKRLLRLANRTGNEVLQLLAKCAQGQLNGITPPMIKRLRGKPRFSLLKAKCQAAGLAL